MRFTNKLYDILKSIAQVWLPAAGTLYFALAGIWGLADANQVVGSITAFDTFLGVVLSISSQSYSPSSDGKIVVDDTHPQKTVYSLELTLPLSELTDKKTVTLEVAPGS